MVDIAARRFRPRSLTIARFLLGAAKFVATLAVAAFVVSCATVQRDILYEAPVGEEPAELVEIESELVLFRAKSGSQDLRAIRSRIAELLAVPSSDSSRTARLYALSAEAALLAGDRSAAARRLSDSAAAYGGDEVAAVVASRLLTKDEDRLDALRKADLVAEAGYRIKAELGSALLASGDFRGALSAFDASLPFLDDSYGLLYGEDRQRAYALRDAEAAPRADSAAYLTKAPITLAGMAVVTQSETNELDYITGGATWATGVLFDRLKASSWYADSSARPSAPATRKDAALFLWRLMARGDNRMVVRYTERYASRATSPVPDLPYGSPYFDAVLGVVEEGIMSLTDGRNFEGDAPASGLDFYGWLMAAVAWR